MVMYKLNELRIGYIPCIDYIQLMAPEYLFILTSIFLMKKLMFFDFLIQALF